MNNDIVYDIPSIEEALKKEKITNIEKYMKDTMGIDISKKDSTGFVDDKSKTILDEFLENMPEAITSQKEELNELLQKYDSPLAEAFTKATPEQKFVELVSSKLSLANSNEEIEKIFIWAEIESKKEFSIKEKVLMILAASLWLDMTQVTYRGIRKMFLEMTRDNTIEVLPEFLKGKDKRDAVQRETCAKLLKAKSYKEIEDIFDWAEIELRLQIGIQDRCVVFFQVAEMIDYDDSHLTNVKKIFIKMNKSIGV